MNPQLVSLTAATKHGRRRNEPCEWEEFPEFIFAPPLVAIVDKAGQVRGVGHSRRASFHPSVLFVTTLVDVNYGNDSGGTNVVAGFPLPYLYFPEGLSPGCTIASVPSLACRFTFQPAYALGDFLLWFSITMLIVYSFAIRRPSLALVALGLAAGLAATLLTLLVPPLTIVAPTPGSEALAGWTPMGFPWNYFINGQAFNVTSAGADYLFWAGIMLAAVCLANALARRGNRLPCPGSLQR